MGNEILWTARRGEVGGRCKYRRRRSNTFTVRLALIRTFGTTFGNAPRKAFGKAFGITRIQGWPVGGEFVFALESTFIRSFTFMIRTTAGALSRRDCRSNRSSVVSKMGHVSESELGPEGGGCCGRVDPD